jgi:hypothetical protein
VWLSRAAANGGCARDGGESNGDVSFVRPSGYRGRNAVFGVRGGNLWNRGTGCHARPGNGDSRITGGKRCPA